MTDFLKVRYDLDTHGWSDLYLEKGNKSHAIRITHVFDCPIESMIQFVEDIKFGNYPTNLILHDEPGAHILKLSPRKSGMPELQIFWTNHNFQSIHDGELIATYEVVPSFLATQIIAELGRIEILMRHKVYQKNRSHFPAHLLKKIK